MTWIESHQTLRDHPKLLRLNSGLGATKAGCIGHLHLLWWWSIDYAPDGNLSRFSPEVVSKAAGWHGRDPQAFMDALVAAGFVDPDLRLHDWDDYAGKLIRRRESEAARKRQERTSGGRTADVARTVPDPTVPTVPNQEIGGDAEVLASKYLGKLAASSERWQEVKIEDLIEVGAEYGFPPLEVARKLGEVWEWWRTTPPSKLWRSPRKGFRVWCRRDQAADLERNGNGQSSAPSLPVYRASDGPTREQREEWGQLLHEAREKLRSSSVDSILTGPGLPSPPSDDG